ncbi:MAG: EthD family reductase [Pseudomonadota bacterium]
MIKLMSFFKRKPGMSVEDFQAYWRADHADLAVKMGGHRRYVQCHTLLSAYRGGVEPVWDGIAEAWFEDTKIIKGLSKTPEYSALRADEINFMDVSTMEYIYTVEHVIKDGPILPDGVKMMLFINRKPGMNIDDFQGYWLEVHGPMAALVPGERRYVQDHTWRAVYNSRRTPIYDGVAQVWFDDIKAMREALKTPEYQRDLADTKNFMSTDTPPFLICKEQIIVP